MLEDGKKILTVEATDLNGDNLTYSLAGGLDEALFNIDQNTGELSFVSAPDYENPGDSNSDGVYEVTVRSSDGALHTDQSMIITVIKTFIEGTLQKDSLTGTSNNDYIKTNGGDDLIDGGDGNDRLIMTGPSSSYRFYEKYGITLLFGGAGSTNGETLVTLVNVEEVEFDDFLWNPPTSSYNYKFGSLGVNDDLLGSNDADVFDPAGGWDRIVGYEGEDVVVIWGYSEDFEVYTKYGITKRFYPDVDIKNLTKEQAKTIYHTDYWRRAKCDEVPPHLRHIYFDMCVNFGQGGAVKVLQRTANAKNKEKIEVDGGMGPATLKAIQNLELERVRAYRVLRFANLVIKKPEQERFWFGWYRRSMEV